MRKNTKKQWIAILMTCVLSMGITACGSKEDTKKNVPETPTEQVQMTQNPKETEVAKQTEVPEDATEGDATSYYVKQYKEVLDTHYDAYKNQWSPTKLQKKKLSLLAAISSKGNPLKELGYSFMDVDGDGSYELLFGTVTETEGIQKVVFEMYTLNNGKPVQVFCSEERNRYYVGQEEDGSYIISNCGASSSTEIEWEYFILKGTELSSVQKIIYSEEADEENPWFRDKAESHKKISQEQATSITNSYEKKQIMPEYTSLDIYK